MTKQEMNGNGEKGEVEEEKNRYVPRDIMKNTNSIFSFQKCCIFLIKDNKKL